MNYPQPEILKAPTTPEYISVPEYKHPIEPGPQTYSFAAASTITEVYQMYFGAPSAGSDVNYHLHSVLPNVRIERHDSPSQVFVNGNTIWATSPVGIRGTREELNNYVAGVNVTIIYSDEPAQGNDRYELSNSSLQIEIENTTLTDQEIILLDSYMTRTQPRYNIPTGVNVSCPIPGVTYGQVMTQTENKETWCGMIHLEVMQGENRAVRNIITHTLKYPDVRREIHQPLFGKFEPWQERMDYVEYWKRIKINGYASLKVRVPAQTRIRLSLFEIAERASQLAPNELASLRGAHLPILGSVDQIITGTKRG